VEFARYPLPVGRPDRDRERVGVLVPPGGASVDRSFDGRRVGVAEQHRDVLAEQFLAIAARQVDEHVVDRDQPTVEVDLIDPVVEHVDERSEPLEGLRLVRLPPEDRSGGFRSFAHTRRSSPRRG